MTDRSDPPPNMSFDDLMSKLGVRKLDTPPPGPRGRRARHRKESRSAPSPRAAPQATEAVTRAPVESASPQRGMPSGGVGARSTPPAQPGPVEPPAPSAARADPPSPAPPAPRDPPPVAEPTVDPDPPGVEAAPLPDPSHAQLDRLRAELASEREKNAALEEQLTLRESRQKALTQQLKLLQGEAPLPSEDLIVLLRERGIRGPDEAGFLFQGLAESQQLGTLLSHLHTLNPPPIRALLTDRLCMVCGGEHCLVPPGRARVLVSAARCEVCGGGDIRQAIRRFLDSCLVFALTQITFFGGPTRAHRQLRDLVAHHRIQFRFIPAAADGQPRPLPSPEVPSRSLLVVMGQPWSDPPARLEQWQRHLLLPWSSIASMLEHAAQELQED